ncbi:MAG: tetratricopeptide repeat protein, partial [Bacteroidota bacterium]
MKTLGYICLLMIWVAKVHGQQGDNRKKIDSLKTLIEQKTALNEEKVDLLNELGYEYWIVDPNQSERYGIQALEIAKILPYPAGKAFANRVIGVAHWARGNLDLSFKFLLEAEKDYAALGDSLGMANSMLNLGMAYADQVRNDIAMQRYEQALDIFRSLGQDSRIATTYSKMADLLIRQGEFDQAYLYLTQALDIHKSTNFLYGIAEANSKLGKIALERNKFTDAISYFLLAVEAGSSRNDHVGLAENYHYIGWAFLQKNDIGQARRYLSSSRELAETYQLKKIQKEVYNTSKDLEVRTSNYTKAIQYYDQYLNIKDSLFNEEKSRIIAQMEAKRSFEEKEQELKIAQKNLDLLREKNTTDRLTKLALGLGILAVMAISWGLLQRQNKRLYKKQQDLNQAEEKSTQLAEVITTKEQELTSYTFNFVQKNELISGLKAELKELKPQVSKEHRPKLDALSRQIDSILRVDKDWRDFRKHFESVHPNLIKQLSQQFPDLTQNEFKLIALVRLNLSSKEISSVLGISPDS